MNKRVDITRDTSEQAKDFISSQITKSILDIRGELSNDILSVVNKLQFEDTQLKYMPDIKTILREKHVNDMLDMLYLDLYVQYADVFNLQDNLTRVRTLFDSTIISMINRVGEISSRVRDFSTLSQQRYSFTDAAHESFNSQANRSASYKKLNINPGAGILRLGGQSEQYCTPEKSNVSLVPISSNMRLIDETDSALSYISDPTEPYYITLITNTNPSNPSYPVFQFSDYIGAVVDLVITFTGVFPISRISFAPFSNAPVEVISMFYSEVPSASFDSTDLTEIDMPTISYDNAEIELNFDRVYAREIHILIKQNQFLLAKEEVDIVQTFGVEEYIDYCSKSLRSSLPMGFTESYDISDQLDQLIEEVRKKTTLPVEKLAANTRSYIVGVYNLKAFNLQYNVFGEYESITRALRGNLSAVSLVFDGDITRSSSEETSDTTTLFSIVTGDREVYLGVPLGPEIVDAVTLEVNQSYTQGIMIPSDTHLYKFDTHFIPDDDQLDDLEMYADGEKLDLPAISASGLVINRKDYSVEIELPTEFAMENGIYDGSVLTVKYFLNTIDRFGRPYDIAAVDILGVLGKPNISDNTAADIFSQYMYTTEVDTSGVVEISRSYESNEYVPIIISGDVYYCIYDGKGEIPGGDILEIEGNIYVKEDATVGPFDDLYYGSIKEEPTYTSGITEGGNNYNEYITDTPYVKGTLKAFAEGYYVPDVLEYDTDTDIIVLNSEEKSRVLVPSWTGTSIKLSYIPIDSTIISKYIDSNIAQHNYSERYTKTSDKKVNLSRYPYIDKSIISSPTFDYSGGLFSLKYKYSIVYEPIIVYVNGVKATNITEYRTGARPQFRDKRRETDYQFYVEGGNKVIFNEDLIGNIVVYYYVISDSFSTRVKMYRSNYFRDDISPELYNYTILANVQR